MASDQQFNLFKVLTERLRHYLEVGDLERAESIAQTAMDSARRALDGRDENLPQFLEALRELASVRLSVKDLPGAELVYQEAFGLARGNRFVSARQIGILKSELAGALDVQDKPNEAVPLYQDAIAMFESASVNEPLLAARLRNNLAMIFKSRGSLEMAEEHYLITLEVFEAAYGAESLEAASIYNNVGGLYQAAGHVERALEMHLKALSLRKQLGEAESVDVGQSLCNVAAAHHALTHAKEAERYYKQARKILALHRDSEPEPFDIATENYRLLLEETGRPPEEADDEDSRPAAISFVDLSQPASAVV
ncbi:MAG: tetratricopeptide (TPR) repeat protein [Verrucomicrobiales bacterium]|jgi:tetratricopeptide (TPR) repeat protein